MIRKRIVNKRERRDLDEFLSRFNMYSVESIIDKYTRYVVSKDEFAIIRCNDALMCNIDEINELANLFNPAIKKEILDIYEDIKELSYREVEYWKVGG